MADGQQRALERRAAQGDLEAAGGLLRARARSGELHADGLWLAAYLGDEAAALALGSETPRPVTLSSVWAALRDRPGKRPGSPAGLWLSASRQHARGWCAGLEPLGTEPLARVALAAARCPEVQRHVRAGAPAAQALAALEAWLRTPGTEEALASLSLAEACVGQGRGGAAHSASLACAYAAYVPAGLVAQSVSEYVASTLQWASNCCPTLEAPAGWDCPEESACLRAPVAAAVRAEVVPWALSRSTPLRED